MHARAPAHRGPSRLRFLTAVRESGSREPRRYISPRSIGAIAKSGRCAEILFRVVSCMVSEYSIPVLISMQYGGIHTVLSSLADTIARYINLLDYN